MSTQRVAIVTGAAQGIGQAVAIRLAEDGLNVTVSDVPSKITSLEKVAAEIPAKGAKAIVVAADVSVEDEVENLVAQTVKELGGLDVMVANAGVWTLVPLFETTVQEFKRVHDINVLGTMLCYRAAAKVMVKQDRGRRLIGASSLAGKRSYPFLVTYSATKYAVRGLTQATACELGQYGITANAYAPGGIDTPLLRDTDALASDLNKIDKGAYMAAASLVQQTALKRLGNPVDVANVVSFLASKDSAYVTGQTISVDGGIHFD